MLFCPILKLLAIVFQFIFLLFLTSICTACNLIHLNPRQKRKVNIKEQKVKKNLEFIPPNKHQQRLLEHYKAFEKLGTDGMDDIFSHIAIDQMIQLWSLIAKALSRCFPFIAIYSQAGLGEQFPLILSINIYCLKNHTVLELFYYRRWNKGEIQDSQTLESQYTFNLQPLSFNGFAELSYFSWYIKYII